MCLGLRHHFFMSQDRVSRIVFPCTFILLNITYWLAFSDILQRLSFP
jgi:hypothetical protein